MTARFIVADVFDGLATIEDGSVDLVITSPPFLALRSYLPADHPDKGKEIGSEPTPAAFLDVMLAVMAELRRVVASHGSVCVELGDTYASMGINWEKSETNFPRMSNKRSSGALAQASPLHKIDRADGWPLAKSRTLIPELFRVALAYGFNPLTGAESPAGRWLVRNVVTWCRPNPPVGALGDKWRPATSDIVVACTSPKRFWDDLATRREHKRDYSLEAATAAVRLDRQNTMRHDNGMAPHPQASTGQVNTSGAPLLDYWEIPLLEGEEPTPYGPKVPTPKPEQGRGEGDKRGAKTDGGWSTLGNWNPQESQGSPLLDYWEIPPTGYAGAHYAVYPPALVEPLVKAMCPQRVCMVCGEPSRRITDTTNAVGVSAGRRSWREDPDTNDRMHTGEHTVSVSTTATARKVTVGWTECGHDNWRPGLVLDPFAGSGTTLAVASGHGHDTIGIDLDARNAVLAEQRIGGLFFEVDQ